MKFWDYQNHRPMPLNQLIIKRDPRKPLYMSKMCRCTIFQVLRMGNTEWHGVKLLYIWSCNPQHSFHVMKNNDIIEEINFHWFYKALQKWFLKWIFKEYAIVYVFILLLFKGWDIIYVTEYWRSIFLLGWLGFEASSYFNE